VITDMIDREIQVDDWVVFYSNLYRVKALGKDRNNQYNSGMVQIMIWNGGRFAKPVKKNSKDMAIIDRNDVLIWLLKKGYK
jgi:hypothetical protein